MYVKADVGTLDGASRVAAEVLDGLGGVDIVVHNAGGHSSGTKPGWEYDEENWREAPELSLLAPARINRGLVPSMVERGGDAIVIAFVQTFRAGCQHVETFAEMAAHHGHAER